MRPMPPLPQQYGSSSQQHQRRSIDLGALARLEAASSASSEHFATAAAAELERLEAALPQWTAELP